MDYLAELNERQRQAVTHLEGPLLVVAGAGAGKTKTITYRILHLIKQGVAPEQILAITFTNKAAREMRERVLKLLGRELEGTPWVGTFHALGVHILREHSRVAGLIKNFSIFDKEDSLAVIKEVMKQLNIDDKRFPPRQIASVISRAKGSGTTIGDYAAGIEGSFQQMVADVWLGYDRELATNRALDFDDLLARPVKLLIDEPSIRAGYLARWPYLHIDEYQDTNTIQYRLTRLLTGPAKNICVVGDTDQSIYSWRGADFTNMLNFERDHPTAKVVRLEENYRSTKNILAAANAVISKNLKRQAKKLFTANPSGAKIKIIAVTDEVAEAAAVATAAKILIEEGTRAGEIAVLYRANFQSRVLEEAFLRADIPYQVLGTRFFERREVKELLAFVRAAMNPADWASIKRIINIPPRGIGKATLAKMAAGSDHDLSPKIQIKVSAFRALLKDIADQITILPPAELLTYILKQSGWENLLRAGSEDDLERLENLGELITLATKYRELPPAEGAAALVAESALVADQDALTAKPTGVCLMTVHAAKGLEFDTVFVTGLEQDLFPHRGLAEDERRDDEEERRLFYVAITRAKRELYLTYAASRARFGSRQLALPSEFIFDIDNELLESADADW